MTIVFEPKIEALKAAKKQVLEAFATRDESETVKRLFDFFDSAGAEVSIGMGELLQTAYSLEDAELYGKILDDCITKHEKNGGKKFVLSAASPG